MIDPMRARAQPLAGQEPDGFGQNQEQDAGAEQREGAAEDEHRFPAELRNQPDRNGTAQRGAERVAHHDHRHNGGAVALRRVFDIQRPGQRQHSAERQSINEAQRKQRPIIVRQREAHGQDSEQRRRENHHGAPADAIAEVAQREAADHGPEQPDAEDVAELDLAEVILRAEVRRREADEVAIQPVEEGDDPRDEHQADEEPAQLLLLDDLGDVNGVQRYYDIKPTVKSWLGMRRFAEILVIAGIFSGVFFFSAATGVARPEYSRRTQKECNFCHPPDSWNLTNAGKYYRDHHYSLQGYTPPASPIASPARTRR